MAYVPVPKDLTKVKTKVALNLTKRQRQMETAMRARREKVRLLQAGDADS